MVAGLDIVVGAKDGVADALEVLGVGLDVVVRGSVHDHLEALFEGVHGFAITLELGLEVGQRCGEGMPLGPGATPEALGGHDDVEVIADGLVAVAADRREIVSGGVAAGKTRYLR